MTELTRQHDNLSPVMSLVRDEIRENMRDIQRQVAPHVRFGPGDMASCSEAECEERLDPLTALAQCAKQLTARCLAAIDRGGNGNPVFLAEGL